LVIIPCRFGWYVIVKNNLWFVLRSMAHYKLCFVLYCILYCIVFKWCCNFYRFYESRVGNIFRHIDVILTFLLCYCSAFCLRLDNLVRQPRGVARGGTIMGAPCMSPRHRRLIFLLPIFWFCCMHYYMKIALYWWFVCFSSFSLDCTPTFVAHPYT